MTFQRPTVSELVRRTRNDVVSRLSRDDVLRRDDAEVYARVMAGVAHGLYGNLSWLANQLIYDTAEAEFLERWASIWKIPRRPAAAATGTVTFTMQAGAGVPEGTLLKALDDVQYQTTEDAAQDGTAQVECLIPSAAGNRMAGEILGMVSPIRGVHPDVLAGTLSGGSNAESDDSLRERLLMRIQQQPQGGALHDYIAWALEVPGVTRVWPSPEEPETGFVTVRFVRDDDVDMIPSMDDVQKVYDHIDTLKPVQAKLVVVAPIPESLFFEISLTPDTLATREAVENELRDLLFREAAPGATILLSHIKSAISLAFGEIDHTLVQPTGNVTHGKGRIAVFGGITWL
jgi:uncharacterized phage protein gp47/JayE